MITKEELKELLHSTETYRVERTTSTNDMDKFQEAICAFSNDLPNSRKNGYLILGAYDNGTLSGLKVTDDLLKKIAAIRSDGNILPIPVMSVDRFVFPEGELLVAEVTPSMMPPVRYPMSQTCHKMRKRLQVHPKRLQPPTKRLQPPAKRLQPSRRTNRQRKWQSIFWNTVIHGVLLKR